MTYIPPMNSENRDYPPFAIERPMEVVVIEERGEVRSCWPCFIKTACSVFSLVLSGLCIYEATTLSEDRIKISAYVVGSVILLIPIGIGFREWFIRH
jgi:hypothetical protein